LNKIKSILSINDLEKFTGIKSHTIRVWEKRYNVFEPKRDKNNVRIYEISDLKKLINISLLIENGNKISRITKFSEKQIEIEVNNITKKIENFSVNSFKIAMLNFDYDLFNKTYKNLTNKLDFIEIYTTVFVPLLNEVGFLWHTNSINPSHEHFVSEIIKQKIIINIDKIQEKEKRTKSESSVFIVFLPENEIHEIGALFIHYLLLLNKKNSIYIGTSIETKDLQSFNNKHDNIIFVGYFTVEPSTDLIKDYFLNFETQILKNNCKLVITGSKSKDIEQKIKSDKIIVIENLNIFIETIECLKH